MFNSQHLTGLQAGGLFIDRAAEEYLRRVLVQANLEEDTFEDYIKTAVEEFELVAKRQFSDPSRPLRVSIADKGFDRPEIGVRRGLITLPGYVSCHDLVQYFMVTAL